MNKRLLPMAVMMISSLYLSGCHQENDPQEEQEPSKPCKNYCDGNRTLIKCTPDGKGYTEVTC